MSLKRYISKLHFIDYLIRKKATGNQRDLAGKVGLSLSGVNEYLREMKDLGFPIKYSRKQGTYYYEKNGQMVDSLFYEKMGKEQMKKVVGGFMFLSS
jgi:predicted transcriptional regulator